MIRKEVRLKLIQDLGLAILALSLIFISVNSNAQDHKPKKSNKKVVKLVFDGMNGKNKKSKNPRRLPASLIEAPKHGNIVQVQDYVHDVEGLDTPKKSIIPKNKKPIANDVEISRDMVIAQ